MLETLQDRRYMYDNPDNIHGDTFYSRLTAQITLFIMNYKVGFEPNRSSILRLVFLKLYQMFGFDKFIDEYLARLCEIKACMFETKWNKILIERDFALFVLCVLPYAGLLLKYIICSFQTHLQF